MILNKDVSIDICLNNFLISTTFIKIVKIVYIYFKHYKMSTLNNNPFRILGIYVTATEREIQKQITKSKRFSEVGKEMKFETDFLFLGEQKGVKSNYFWKDLELF